MLWRIERSFVTDRNWTLDHPAHYIFTVITTPSSSTHMLRRHLISLYLLFEVCVSLLLNGGHWLVIFSVSGMYVKGHICRFRKLHDHWEEIIHIVMWSASEMPFGSQTLQSWLRFILIPIVIKCKSCVYHITVLPLACEDHSVWHCRTVCLTVWLTGACSLNEMRKRFPSGNNRGFSMCEVDFLSCLYGKIDWWGLSRVTIVDSQCVK
jgi:hypothetical protein